MATADDWWVALFRATTDAVDHVPYAAAPEYPTPHVAAFRAAAESLGVTPPGRRRWRLRGSR